jgi:hypothetical protein
MARSHPAINRTPGSDKTQERRRMFGFVSRLFIVAAIFAAARWSAAAPADRPTAGPVEPEAVQIVERRLDQLADDEAQETGPEYPRYASQAAYHLLAGLVVGRPQVTNLADDDRLKFGLSTDRRSNGVLFEINREARIASTESRMQDKSGSYVIRRHVLYVLRSGRWIGAGGGAIAGPVE